jgi:uncharacterized membrane protein YqgA involved in biofilm formation
VALAVALGVVVVVSVVVVVVSVGVVVVVAGAVEPAATTPVVLRPSAYVWVCEALKMEFQCMHSSTV